MHRICILAGAIVSATHVLNLKVTFTVCFLDVLSILIVIVANYIAIKVNELE